MPYNAVVKGEEAPSIIGNSKEIRVVTKAFKKAGQWLTRALFLETSYMDQSNVVYTLKDEDDLERGFPSLYKLYMAMEDLTEWKFAHTHLGGWEHWEELTNTIWFKKYVNRWRKELELKIKYEALEAIRQEALASTKNSFTANKFLVEKGWIERPEGKRGRPTKEEIKQEFNTIDLKGHLKRMESPANDSSTELN